MEKGFVEEILLSCLGSKIRSEKSNVQSANHTGSSDKLANKQIIEETKKIINDRDIYSYSTVNLN